jgi:Ca-activated chloride channel family protein
MATFRPRQFTSLLGIVAISVALQPTLEIHAQDAQPVFKAGVALVPITALVRDSRNRIVKNLGLDDFQVLERGRPRPIVDFGANDKAPINVAFLLDTSGSMQVASNMARAKDLIEEFVGGIEPTLDQVALFTFDKSLRREVSFTNDGDQVYDALDGVKPWGLTSIYDAVAQTAKQLGDRTSQRRAVVVITDGADTSSALTPAEVSGLASSIDVPVYVVAVVSPLDHPGAPAAVVSDNANGGLANVAEWTGGELLYVSESNQIPVIAQELLRTMRHQYLLAIESSQSAGWYQLEVRTKRRGLTVRARSGYFAGEPPRASRGGTDRAPLLE